MFTRPTKTADSIVPSRRSRNSLSPISRSVQPGSPRNRRHHHHHHNGMNGDNGYEGLEIRGSHIVAKQLMPRLDVKAVRTKQARAKRLEGQWFTRGSIFQLFICGCLALSGFIGAHGDDCMCYRTLFFLFLPTRAGCNYENICLTWQSPGLERSKPRMLGES